MSFALSKTCVRCGVKRGVKFDKKKLNCMKKFRRHSYIDLKIKRRWFKKYDS